PFAKPVEDNPDLTERFQLIVDGMEIVNGFSELNDPIDQRQRMEEQERKYRSGNQEASRLDEDFLEALEYGMPPAAGWGIGIDRLVALVTKSHNIKEVIAFPTLKPKS
ncbi:MAG: lysine--tRNA ligase, partial [Candidatus Nealsonbacteria bacterium CG_4_9_14_0_8_um_filter_36_17]